MLATPCEGQLEVHTSQGVNRHFLPWEPCSGNASPKIPEASHTGALTEWTGGVPWAGTLSHTLQYHHPARDGA